MSAADCETIAQELPRVLNDAYRTLTRARAAAERASDALDGAARKTADALAAARAADLSDAADAETRRSNYAHAERRQRVVAHELRGAIEDHRSEIASFEDRVARARTWLADARAGGASAESVAAAERAIDAAERRACVERLQAEGRGWIRRARPVTEVRAAAPADASKTTGVHHASTSVATRRKRRGPKEPRIAIIDGVEFVVGTDSMLKILRAEHVGCREQALLDALNNKGEIEGATVFGDGKNPPWAVPRSSLVAWGRERRLPAP